MQFTKMHGCGNDYIYVWLDEDTVARADMPPCVRALYEDARAGDTHTACASQNPHDGDENAAAEKDSSCKDSYLQQLTAVNENTAAEKDSSAVNSKEAPGSPDELRSLIIRMSDRHMGIGGDGVIFIRRSFEEGADFEMLMFNADGSRGSMCGNGIRCVAAYVYEKGLTDKESFTVSSMGVPHELVLNAENKKVKSVRVDMGEPIFEPNKIPFALPAGTDIANGNGFDKKSISAFGKNFSAENVFANVPFFVSGNQYLFTPVSMGNPHAVVVLPFETKLAAFDVKAVGSVFENAPFFPDRTNTEFVHIDDRNNVHMRVWERGAGETLCCGTGCCAITAACVLNGLTDTRLNVHCIGGDILCELDSKSGHIFMTGPAETAFEGEAFFS